MKRLPHVLQFINSFSDGGTERQAIQLANALHHDGAWCVTVVAHDGEGPLRDLLAPSVRARVVTFPLHRLVDWDTLRQMRAFRRLLARAQVDILHTHGFYPNIFGTFAAQWSGTRVCIASKREQVALRTPARARVERVALSRATHVVTNCAAVRAELLATGMRADGVSTIYNAVVPERVLSSPNRHAELPDVDSETAWSAPVVTMVANFHHAAKDQATMLRAARRVVDVLPNARFVLVGDGPDRSEMRDLVAALRLEGSVLLPGRCSDISSLLERAAVCALSSRSEGLPNAILEYMAAGRPVVATNVGGVAEAMVDGVTGYLVAAGDDGAMADRILTLLADRAVGERMGAAGRSRVRREFTLARQVDAVAALYRRELARVSTSSR